MPADDPLDEPPGEEGQLGAAVLRVGHRDRGHLVTFFFLRDLLRKFSVVGWAVTRT